MASQGVLSFQAPNWPDAGTMSPVTDIDVALLVVGVAAWAIVGITTLIARNCGRDQIFDGPNPGVIPRDPESAPHHRVKGMRREYSGEVAVAFSPPRGVRPGVLGTVVDGTVDSHDLTATIVDLAVRGHLTIAAVPADQPPHPHRRFFARRPVKHPKTDWVLTRVTAPAADELDINEGRLLEGLFEKSTVVRMSQLDKDALHALRNAQASFYSQLVRRGWYPRHPRRRRGLGGSSITIGFMLSLVLVVANEFSPASLVAGALVFTAGFGFMLASRVRTPRTALGSAVRIEGLSFKRYLATAEARQFAFEEAAGIFSRYLPYAMVLGVAEHWAKTFAKVAQEASLAGWSGDFDADLQWADWSSDPSELVWDGLDGGLDLLDGVGHFDLSLDFLDGLGDGCADVDGCLGF